MVSEIQRNSLQITICVQGCMRKLQELKFDHENKEKKEKASLVLQMLRLD